MKSRRWKTLLSLSMAISLCCSSLSYASQIIIEPLDTQKETQTPSGTSQGPGEAVLGQGPGEQSQSAENPGQGTGNTFSHTQAAPSVQKPVIEAEGAVLLDAATGKVLYGKNENTTYYPASITKLMTALLVAERCNLDDTVSFSAKATTNLESGAVTINMTEGDKMTVRQCLYALLLKSANEMPWQSMWQEAMRLSQK